MKCISITISAALLLSSVSLASATQRGYEPTKPVNPAPVTNNYGGKGGDGGTGVGVGIGIGKGGNASVKNSGNSYNNIRNSNKQQQGQAQGQKQSIKNSGNSKSSSSSNSSVSNSGNSSVSGSGNSSVNIVNKQRLQAPSVVLGDGNSTAPCQGYTNFGASFPGGGFGFGASRTVKFCETEFNARLYQGYFGAGVARAYLVKRDPVLRSIVGDNPVVVKKVVKTRKAKKNCNCR